MSLVRAADGYRTGPANYETENGDGAPLETSITRDNPGQFAREL